MCPTTRSEAERLYESLTRAKRRLEQHHGRLGEVNEASLQLERAITRRLTRLSEKIRATESRDPAPKKRRRTSSSPSKQRRARNRTRSHARTQSHTRTRRDERRPYWIEPLTPRDYATLRWLADRGYDGGFLQLAGVEEELPDGRIVMGALTESEAWQFRENVDEDPGAFLSSSGSRTLNDKLLGLYDGIV